MITACNVASVPCYIKHSWLELRTEISKDW